MHARRSFLHWLRRCVWALAAMAALAPAVIAGQAAVRASAAPASVSAVEGKARTILDQALTARNPDTRKAAVQALGLIGPREPYMGRLMTMIRDPDVAVRVAAIDSLVDLDDPRVRPAIRHAFDDPVPEVSFAAAKALQAMNDPVGRDALIAVLAGGDDAQSGYVTRSGRSLARIYYTPKTAIPFLLARGIGMAHVAGLGAGVASVRGLLADQNLDGRAAAALLLGDDPDPRVVPALRAALQDKGAAVRAAAVHALAMRDDPGQVSALLPMLDDGSIEVRVRAAAAVLRLQWIAARDRVTPARPPASRRLR